MYVCMYVCMYRFEGGRAVLRRALQSLPHKKHVSVIAKFAQLEYKYGAIEYVVCILVCVRICVYLCVLVYVRVCVYVCMYMCAYGFLWCVH